MTRRIDADVPEDGGYASAKPASTVGSADASKAISSWPTGKKLVALTYDDGPHPTITPKLLELLQQKRAKATFYLLGEMVRANPRLARSIAEAGMEVANHSYSHKQFTKLSEAGLNEQITKTHELITSATGAPVTTMRPPYGATNSRVNEYARKLGYHVVLWDVDTNDWRKRTAEQQIQTILNETRDGSIILMHDRYQSTLDTTAAVIDALRARGFEFVTVAELLSQQRLQSGTTKAAAEPGGTARANSSRILP